jgi:mercuric reductase
LDTVPYLTNETAFELETLPESLLVLGGRYIALECAQMFARFGSRVTVLQRSDRILPDEAPDLTEALTGFLRDEGLEIVTGVNTRRVTQDKEGVVVEADVHGQRRTYRATHLLVATGRAPNVENVGLEAVGVKTTARGAIAVDDTLQTSVPGIYAAGDVLGENMFVYTAAYEGALAVENALNRAKRKRDYTALPWVIFTDPQVAGVGLDEKQAEQQGIDAQTATLPLSHVPRSLAARDTRGFIKLIRDRQTDRLVGARILAAEGSELLMEVSLAIKFGITARQLTASFHPYLTLSEGVKLAALVFHKNIKKLSCCAS